VFTTTYIGDLIISNKRRYLQKHFHLTLMKIMLEALTEELKSARAFEADMRKFADVVTQNDDIQKKLSDAVDNGISRDDFRNLYVETAAENGIKFSVEQMDIAMHEQKQGKDKVLPSFVQKLITIL